MSFVPNPANSPNEKWQPSRWGLDVRRHRLRQLLLQEGVEEPLAIAFASAMAERALHRSYEKRELLEEFSRWANVHTHPGLGALGFIGTGSWIHRTTLPVALGDLATGYDEFSGLVYLAKGNTDTSASVSASTNDRFWKMNVFTLGFTELTSSSVSSLNNLFTGVFAEGKFYLLSKEFAVYDPLTDTWTALTTCPSYMEGCPMVYLDGTIFVGPSRNTFGGASQQFWGYDIAAGTWSRFSDLSVSGLVSPNEHAALYVHSGKVYLLPSDPSVYDPREWDPSTDSWSVVSTTGTPPGVGPSWGTPYGFFSQDHTVNSLFRLPFDTWTWENLNKPTDLSRASEDLGTFVANSRLWLIGGTTNNNLDGDVDSIELEIA